MRGRKKEACHNIAIIPLFRRKPLLCEQKKNRIIYKIKGLLVVRWELRYLVRVKLLLKIKISNWVQIKLKTMEIICQLLYHKRLVRDVKNFNITIKFQMYLNLKTLFMTSKIFRIDLIYFHVEQHNFISLYHLREIKQRK